MSTSAPSRTPQEIRPTRVRYGVVGFAVTLAIITYFDRVTLSKAQGLISADLHLSKQQMGWVFAAFAGSYALFEIPSGYLGDRLGPRRVLMRIVIWWSTFTALMGITFNFGSLFFTQLFFGAGGSRLFPQHHKSVLHLASAGRACSRSRGHLAGGPMGRRIHAHDCLPIAAFRLLASGFHAFRMRRGDMGRALFPLVSG